MDGNRNKNVVTILAIALILSLGANVFLFMKKNEVQTQMQTKIDTLYIEKSNIEDQLELTSGELDKYKGINDSLDKVVAEGQSQIAALEEDIKKLKSSAKKDASKKKELQAKIEELNKLVESYLEKIDQLITENQLLKNQNAELTTQVADMTEQNKNLQGRVNVAALVRAEYVKVTGMKKKVIGDGYSESSVARKVDKIKVDFSLLDNKNADSGDKNVHVRIIAPDGSTLGASTFKGNDTGSPIEYTSTVILQYDKTKKSNGSVEYAGTDFKPGNYKVEIYVDGFLTGGGGVVLK